MRKIVVPSEARRRHFLCFSRGVADKLGRLCRNGFYMRKGKPIKLSSYELSYLDEIMRWHIADDLDCNLISGGPEYIFHARAVIAKDYAASSVAQLNDELKTHVFNYKGFFTGRKIKGLGRWSSADFIQMLDISVCPYCNADTIYAVPDDFHSDAYVARSSLDHYFPQDEYPYLALALYNLVPACTRCNTSLKRNSFYDPVTTAHPYVTDVHSSLSLETIVDNCAVFYGQESADGLHFAFRRKRESATARRSYELIVDRLEGVKIYNGMFKRDAADILTKIVMMESGLYASLRKIFCGMTRTGMQRLILGYGVDEANINRCRLSKMTIDMLRQFCDHKSV